MPNFFNRTTAAAGTALPHLTTFLYLQALDFLTTLVGIKFGFIETSPFIRQLMQSNVTMGLLEAKLLGVLLAVACIAVEKGHLVRWINRWYAVLVIWNLAMLFLATPK
jgi:hypothetical protein